MLVSSGCFFNNLGSITSQAVDDLHLATKVASLLCKHAKFSKQLPELVWLMRDFSLDLVDRNGLPISADVYFEQCIDKCATSKADEIRALFPLRRCLPLTRPTVEDTDLREMKNLRAEFIDGIGHIRTIVRNFSPKLLGDNHLSGDQLCSLTEALCTVLNSKAVPNLDDVWQLVALQSRQSALQQAKEAFASSDTSLTGLSAAYLMYKEMVLDDNVSGDDTFTLLHGLLVNDIRGQKFEDKYIETKRELDIHVAASIAQMKDAEGRIRDYESNLASSHRKVARLVDENLTAYHRIKEMENVPMGTIPDQTHLIEVLEVLQTKHKELKLEVAEKRRMLNDVVQTIHTQDRTISEHANRMLAERKMLSEQRTKTTELETRVSDLKSNFQQATTDVAIWRTRYEDVVSRGEKKRKVNDDMYTELISLTSEVNFLRNRHEEDAKQILRCNQESVTWCQQIQTLQVKLALEIGK
jgi:hypothetical protein